jgi:hypothetical protein
MDELTVTFLRGQNFYVIFTGHANIFKTACNPSFLELQYQIKLVFNTPLYNSRYILCASLSLIKRLKASS